jgi:hypothetical protein
VKGLEATKNSMMWVDSDKPAPDRYEHFLLSGTELVARIHSFMGRPVWTTFRYPIQGKDCV